MQLGRRLASHQRSESLILGRCACRTLAGLDKSECSKATSSCQTSAWGHLATQPTCQLSAMCPQWAPEDLEPLAHPTPLLRSGCWSRLAVELGPAGASSHSQWSASNSNPLPAEPHCRSSAWPQVEHLFPRDAMDACTDASGKGNPPAPLICVLVGTQ